MGLDRHGSEGRGGPADRLDPIEGSNERASCSPFTVALIVLAGASSGARLDEDSAAVRQANPMMEPPQTAALVRATTISRDGPRHPDPRQPFRRSAFLRSTAPKGYRPAESFWALEANTLYGCSLSSQHFSVELPRNRLRLRREALEACDGL